MLGQKSPTASTETPIRFFESRGGDSVPRTAGRRTTIERHSRSGLLESRTPFIPTNAASFLSAHSEQFDFMADAVTYAPASAAGTAVSPRATMLARTVSDICSPAALALPCLLLAAWSSEAPGAIWYAVLYAAVAVPLPMLYVVWLVKTGRVTDFHLPNRHERARPFAVALVSALIAVALLVVLGAGHVLGADHRRVHADLLAVSGHAGLANQHSHGNDRRTGDVRSDRRGRRWCICHADRAASGLGRIHLGRHTLAQTIAGALLGCGMFIAMFALRGIAW